MKFRKRGDRQLVQQHFNKEEITITKNGETYNVYDAIQAANVDTDIVEVMKKYHCTEEEGIEYMKRKGGMQGLYGEFAELQQKAQTIPEILALKQKSDEMFKALPTEIKEKYGNDLNKFFTDLNEKAKEIKETDNKTETKTEEK